MQILVKYPNSTSVFLKLYSISLHDFLHINFRSPFNFFYDCPEQLFTLLYNLNFGMASLKARPASPCFHFLPTILLLAHDSCSKYI